LTYVPIILTMTEKARVWWAILKGVKRRRVLSEPRGKSGKGERATSSFVGERWMGGEKMTNNWEKFESEEIFRN